MLGSQRNLAILGHNSRIGNSSTGGSSEGMNGVGGGGILLSKSLSKGPDHKSINSRIQVMGTLTGEENCRLSCARNSLQKV